MNHFSKTLFVAAIVFGLAGPAAAQGTYQSANPYIGSGLGYYSSPSYTPYPGNSSVSGGWPTFQGYYAGGAPWYSNYAGASGLGPIYDNYNDLGGGAGGTYGGSSYSSGFRGGYNGGLSGYGAGTGGFTGYGGGYMGYGGMGNGYFGGYYTSGRR